MLCTTGYNFLRNEIKRFKGNYLEIGIFDGDLISSLARENPNKNFYGIDPFIEDGHTIHTTKVSAGNTIVNQKQVALSKLDELSNLKYYIETSLEFLNKLTDEQCRELDVDIVLIDGSHWYKDVIIDSEIALKLIKSKKGIIIFDDLHVPEVLKACDEFLNNHQSIITKVTNTDRTDVNMNSKPNTLIVFVNGGELDA
jgi:hypothetical protein